MPPVLLADSIRRIVPDADFSTLDGCDAGHRDVFELDSLDFLALPVGTVRALRRRMSPGGIRSGRSFVLEEVALVPSGSRVGESS
jgi:hypothetical protein